MTMYECHITIEPVFGPRLDEAKAIAAHRGFKVASLLMAKEGNELEPSRNDTFMTGHHTDYRVLQVRMIGCIRELVTAGFTVWRYKIEAILLDSKYQSDPLNLLPVGVQHEG